MSSTGFFSDYEKSIKNRIVEEKYDLYFSRPAGFVLAKFFHVLGFRPTGISVLGMLIGVTGGILLYWQNQIMYSSIAFVLVTFAGVMDSADGQAARLYDQRSEMGKYLDFFNDLLVFISCYVFGALHFTDVYTLPGTLAIMFAAGYVHSDKSNLYEFYKGELLYFSLTDFTHRNPPPEDIRENFDRESTFVRKGTYPILLNYIEHQNKIKFRSDEVTKIFQEAHELHPEKFKEIYTDHSRNVLTAWAWICGSNITRNGILISSLFGRFDLFLFANIASYGLFLLLGRYQNKVDREIIDDIKSWDLTSLEEMSVQSEK